MRPFTPGSRTAAVCRSAADVWASVDRQAGAPIAAARQPATPTMVFPMPTFYSRVVTIVTYIVLPSFVPNDMGSQPTWLLLVHQLPPRPSNLRVHVWRRLQQVGAVALRNALYVLPNTPDAREDFEWIRAEITGRGGQVSILGAQAVDGYTDDELESAFRNARTREYTSLTRHVEAIERRLMSKKPRVSRAAVRREVAKARERLGALKSTDFFGAAGAGEARAALERLEQALQPPSSGASAGDRLDRRFFRRRVWVTRPRPGIDRMASAWLIRRFIAQDARFAFAPAPVPDHIAFDMPNVEFGHQGSDCTYETLVRRFA